MNIVRVVYESGIQAALQDGRWRLASCDFDPPVTFGTLPAATSGLRLRPILITEILTNRRERTFLLDATAKDLIALRISTFTGLGSTGSEIFHFHHLSYLLGAVAYHCERLAQLYAEICHEFVRVRFPDTSETNFVTFEYQPDPYYEFDALVTAARRTYDYSRYLLWQAFGDGSSSVPRSLAATLPCCNHMPPQLRTDRRKLEAIRRVAHRLSGLPPALRATRLRHGIRVHVPAALQGMGHDTSNPR
jgi:hypothetical protein